MPVSDKHEDYLLMEDERKLVKAAASGERAIKALGPLALSPPDINADGVFNAYRYQSYKQRASYTNYTGRTKNGSSGAAFRNNPTVELPDRIECARPIAPPGSQDRTSDALRSADPNS